MCLNEDVRLWFILPHQQCFRFSAAIHSALGSLNICLQCLNKNKHKTKVLLLFWCTEKKEPRPNFLISHLLFKKSSKDTLQKNFFFFFWHLSQLNFQALLMQSWHFAAFANTLFSTASYSLSNCCSSAAYSLPRSTAFSCAVAGFLCSPPGQVPATSQPSQTAALCRCQHHYVS